MGRIQSEETKKKISNSLKGAKKNSHFSENARLKLAEASKKRAKKREEFENTLSLNEISYLPISRQKKLFRLFHKNACQICGWNKVNKLTKRPLTQIHHIDGNNKNECIENWQLLCPNCHSETENFMFHGRKHAPNSG